MTQTSIDFDRVTLDLTIARSAKAEGMAIAGEAKRQLLESIRQALVKLASNRAERSATADDAQAWLITQGFYPADLGNAAGSLFLKGDWEFTGRWEESKRVSSHGRMIRVWKLR